MLPILTNLKNSISCSLKKINNVGHNNKNESGYQSKKSFDIGINNIEYGNESHENHHQNQSKKKGLCKKKSKSFSKSDKNYYYQDYMSKRFSMVTTRSEFFLNSPNEKESFHQQEHVYYDENVNDLNKQKDYDSSKSKKKSKKECTSSTASLPVNFDSSNLNLTNKLSRGHRTKSTRLKSFSNFFKKFGLFGMSNFKTFQITI